MFQGKVAGIFLLSILFLISFSLAAADYKAEFSVSGGHTGNLFSDSSRQIDNYVMNRATVRLYPISFMEIKLDGEYSHYADIINLTSVYGNAGVTIIPTPDDWPFSLYINGYYNSRAYGGVLEEHNSDNYGSSISLGYDLLPWLRLRTGASYKATNYPEVEFDSTDIESFDISRDYDNYKAFIGLNVTLPYSNVLDIEFSYEQMNLFYVEPPVPTDTFYNSQLGKWVRRDYLNPSRDTSVIDGNYNVTYISPRLSRPIGSKTGINITYMYSDFSDIDNIVLPRISNKFLSPWTAFWTGEAVSLNLKTYILPGFIVNCGWGYWEKAFLNTEEERHIALLPSWVIKTRYDFQEKRYLSLQKPILLHGGTYLEPNIQIDYTYNNSSNDLYDYSHYSFAAGLTLRF